MNHEPKIESFNPLESFTFDIIGSCYWHVLQTMTSFFESEIEVDNTAFHGLLHSNNQFRPSSDIDNIRDLCADTEKPSQP